VTANREAHGDARERAAALGAWLRETLAPGAALVSDSRALRPGDAFLAWPGAHTDGRRYVDAAVTAGAAAVLYEAADADALGLRPDGAQGVRMRAVDDLRSLAGPIAADYYGHPAERLRVVAVTGTNGKTTCTQWMAAGFAASGRRCAVIGTLGSGIVESGAQTRFEDVGLTTPDAVALQRLLARFVEAGVELVAMEASSIGIDQGRLDGLQVDTAILTNFSRDHLDYHGDEQAYLAAKLRLFSWPGLRTAIINGDDPVAPTALDAVPRDVTTIAFGQLPGEHGWRARKKLSAWQITEGPDAMEVSVGGDYGRAQVNLELLGRFNVVNATAVAATWISFGMPFDEAMQRLAVLQAIPGRMQRVEAPDAPLVIVDYAHTPDALVRVLDALRPVVTARGGQLWCVFGAGGERDAGKRPLMGLAAERHADRLVVTSDNPRGETPFRIVSDIRAGLTREPWLTEIDRRKATASALQAASAADVVLIAGKGHENYQEIRGERHPYSDVETAAALLAGRRQSKEHADA